MGALAYCPVEQVQQLWKELCQSGHRGHGEHEDELDGIDGVVYCDARPYLVEPFLGTNVLPKSSLQSLGDLGKVKRVVGNSCR
jgi:hypothetical protein